VLDTKDDFRPVCLPDAKFFKLGDPRAPAAYLDRIEYDPSGTALTSLLIEKAGAFRQVDSAPRLLAMMDKESWRDNALYAVLAISGYDQWIQDPDDEFPHQKWEEEQHPRHDQVLADLMEKCLSLGMTGPLNDRLVAGARWSKTNAVDEVLASLAGHPDDSLRRSAVEALSWRLRERSGSPDPLLKALEHKDGVTKFIAAEGLALFGRNDGLSILLSSVELMEDLGYRINAVEALGELADERALDLLLRLASEDDHALQESAIEAVGHWGQSAKAETILRLLTRWADGDDDRTEYALRGLRWFDSAEAWKLLRKVAVDNAAIFQGVALDMLGYHDDPAHRDILLQTLSTTTDDEAFTGALEAARRIWGADSLEYVYSWLKNPDSEMYEYEFDADKLYAEISQQGDPTRIFEVLPFAKGALRDKLTFGLLAREKPPVKEAVAALQSNDANTVQAAAQILGRSADKKQAKLIGDALDRWRQIWSDQRQKMLRENASHDHHLQEELTPCLKTLVWSAGRHAAAQKTLIEMLSDWPADPCYRSIRKEVALALGAGKSSKATTDALASAAESADQSTRITAALALAEQDPKAAAKAAQRLLSDRSSFNRVAKAADVSIEATLHEGLSHQHYQSIVLPHLIAAADVDALAKVMRNAKAADATRLGAIEGLGAMAVEAAEAQLVAFGEKEKNEELRKAAWNARRRSIRARDSRLSLRESSETRGKTT